MNGLIDKNRDSTYPSITFGRAWHLKLKSKYMFSTYNIQIIANNV